MNGADTAQAALAALPAPRTRAGRRKPRRSFTVFLPARELRELQALARESGYQLRIAFSAQLDRLKESLQEAVAIRRLTGLNAQQQALLIRHGRGRN